MPQMQRPLLQLGLYNMYLKQKLVQSAYHQISSPQQATDLLHGLNYDDLCFSAKARANGLSRGTDTSRFFLNSIDAVTKRLPHSNEAAINERGKIEGISHEKGCPHFF